MTVCAMATSQRDRLGRPLRGADVARAFPQFQDGAPSGPIDAAETIALAQQYLADDLPFHVHEVFEQRWRCCPEQERALWRALAQWGAALTHAARGNARGAHQVGLRSLTGLLEILAEHQPDGGTCESGLAGPGVNLAVHDTGQSTEHQA